MNRIARGRRQAGRGYTYLVLLILLAVLSLAAALTMELVQTGRQREAEAELLAVGKEFEHAFASFYRQSAPGQRPYPDRLEDLLRDPRSPAVKRHLRRLYVDPLSGQPWQTVPAPGGGIMAVYSGSTERPFRERWPALAMAPAPSASAPALTPGLTSAFAPPAPRAPQPFGAASGVMPEADDIAPATSYAQWRFGYDPNTDRSKHRPVILPTRQPASAPTGGAP